MATMRKGSIGKRPQEDTLSCTIVQQFVKTFAYFLESRGEDEALVFKQPSSQDTSVGKQILLSRNLPRGGQIEKVQIIQEKCPVPSGMIIVKASSADFGKDIVQIMIA